MSINTDNLRDKAEAMIRGDLGAAGAYHAAVSPVTLLSLLDEVQRLRAVMDAHDRLQKAFENGKLRAMHKARAEFYRAKALARQAP